MTPYMNSHTFGNRTFADTSDETLIEDTRGSMRPSQQVDNKLVSMMKSVPLHLGQLHSSRPLRGRN